MSMRPEDSPLRVKRTLLFRGKPTRRVKVLEVGTSVSFKPKGSETMQRTLSVTDEGVRVARGGISNGRGGVVPFNQQVTDPDVFDRMGFQKGRWPLEFKYLSIRED